jgi:ribosome maturation factor RimP
MADSRMALIESLIEPSIAAMGYQVVRVQYSGTKRPRLQVMAERVDGTGMTVDDCADLSRAISAILDVEDPLPTAYLLEVSSPGLDRPLVKPADFERFAGYEVRLETTGLIDGRRRFRGRLEGMEGDLVVIVLEDKKWALPFDEVESAKLVITDELIQASLQKRD